MTIEYARTDTTPIANVLAGLFILGFAWQGSEAFLHGLDWRKQRRDVEPVNPQSEFLDSP
ncbi:MAG: hypothetical protein M5U26_28160 [Planctomycetota bacterium]|nr:hypothetical protein [Planctomycetota bacterium]